MTDRTLQQFNAIGESLKFNLKYGHILASIILTYSYINVMASLIRPEKQKEVTGNDFKNWVNSYMKTDINQHYQYKGIDLWGARCGLVHRYSPYSSLSEDGKCKILQYHNGSEHIYNPGKNKNLVTLSANRLVNDFYQAMFNFLGDLMNNEYLRKRANKRFENDFFRIKKIST